MIIKEFSESVWMWKNKSTGVAYFSPENYFSAKITTEWRHCLTTKLPKGENSPADIAVATAGIWQG